MYAKKYNGEREKLKTESQGESGPNKWEEEEQVLTKLLRIATAASRRRRR